MTVLGWPSKQCQGAPRTEGDHVVILLASRNGARWLPDQLTSLRRQTHTNWSLIVSDDGSNDDSCAIVDQFAERTPEHRVTLLNGSEQGSAQNFLSLIRAAGSAPFVAFCDQDDYWFGQKLEAAIAALHRVTGPAAYGSRTVIADQDLHPLRPSLLFRKRAEFGNALVQNIAGGNTMVLNRAALDILQPASQFADGVIAHDWWCYQMITGCGGQFIYDPWPSLLYRQHAENLVGANDHFSARLHRLQNLRGGQFAKWLDAHTAALNGARRWLTPAATAQLDRFGEARQGHLIRRMISTRRARIYRQTWPGTAALWGATAMGWV